MYILNLSTFLIKRCVDYNLIVFINLLILLQGVLRDGGDLHLFDKDFQEAYKERQVDPFADIY